MAQDEKLTPAEEIERDKAKEAPADFDPLLAQAERLPDSIKGSDGEKEHVLPVGENGEPLHSAPQKDAEDAFDPKPSDPSKLTADS